MNVCWLSPSLAEVSEQLVRTTTNRPLIIDHSDNLSENGDLDMIRSYAQPSFITLSRLSKAKAAECL